MTKFLNWFYAIAIGMAAGIIVYGVTKHLPENGPLTLGFLACAVVSAYLYNNFADGGLFK